MGGGLSFGSDPEFMITDRKGNLVSAVEVLQQYSKDNKLKIGDQAIFYDNVNLEMNLRPARTLLEFQTNFQECLEGTRDVLRELGEFYIEARSSADFPIEQMQSPEAKVFGCEPEFCIYHRNEENKILRVEPPILDENSTFRSCGGHIHIGHVCANWVEGGDPAEVIKQMDGLVGIVSVILDNDPTSLARRKLYGLAGSHRVTPYGVEYRTLGNFWFTNPDLVKIIYHLTKVAIEFVLTKNTIIDNIVAPKDLQTIINTANKEKALIVFKQYSDILPFNLGRIILNYSSLAHRSSFVFSLWTAFKGMAA
jgi:hypothetical protein